MVEKTYQAWLAKNRSLKEALPRWDVEETLTFGLDEMGIGLLYRTRKTRDYWWDAEWPPRKVKVTVRIEEL